MHISQLCDKFIKHPMEVVKVGDVVKVWVLEVDMQRGRVSLTMKDPNKPAAQKQEKRHSKPSKNKNNKRQQPEKDLSSLVGGTLGGIQIRRRRS